MNTEDQKKVVVAFHNQARNSSLVCDFRGHRYHVQDVFVVHTDWWVTIDPGTSEYDNHYIRDLSLGADYVNLVDFKVVTITETSL